jgi:hypothetical protein
MATESSIESPEMAFAGGTTTASGWLARVLARCNRPVDGASLAVFRLLFGGVMAVAMVRLLAKAWVQELYLAPKFHFTWEWLPWVRVLPGTGMYWLVGGLALLALGVAVGWRQRWCAALFFLGFTYLELIDQTTYLNHYYLVSLLSGMLVFMPAGTVWSLDARGQESSSVPTWTVWLLRFQFCVVYGFAGLAKLSADWLIAAQPMRIWLTARSDLPLIGPWLAEPWVAYAASWTGALYDLTIPFWLLWARSRAWAYLTVVVFHLATLVLFRIGMFPWIMLAGGLIFFPPEWPRFWTEKFRLRARMTSQASMSGGRLSAWSLGLLCAYAVVQVALPLRSLLHPQQGAWDGRGFNFAWRVMLVEKTGYAEFHAFNPATRVRERLSVNGLITPRQRMLMAQDPDMIRQLALRLAEDLPAAGKVGWEIHADAWATFDGRPSQRLVRPEVNLAGPLPPDWIVPLKVN